MKTRLCLWLAAVLAVAAGCDSETGVNPAPLTAPTTTSDGGGGATGYQAPIRKVELRSPMGNLPGNLLMDGDFEWTQILEGDSPQAAWYNFGSPQNHVRLATGGRCLSGLRCGIMRSQDLFYGRGSAAKASGMIATVAAKPPPGDGCEALVAYAIPCDFNGLSADLSAVSMEPDKGGWCHYRVGVAQQNDNMCIVLQPNELTMDEGEEMLVDAARIIPDDGTVPLRAFTQSSAARRQRLQPFIDRLRRSMPIGPPAPSRARIGNR